MNILFLLHRTGRARHFDGVIRSLAERGHTVTLAVVAGGGEVRRPKGLDHRRVSIVECPELRGDAWRDLVRPLRVARDCIRYLDPRFKRAAFLRRRADVRFANLAGPLKRSCERWPWLRRRWRLLERALGAAEELIPSDRVFEAFIRARRPDIILVTPLILFGSYQTDYVKAAHRLGLPIALLPFSWDNLSMEGLIRVAPDRVLVWNETQRREAIELHGMPPERVIATGAPRFDDFFAIRPTTTRDEFCAQVGLDPALPFILYLCSADFVTTREGRFVRRWIAALRRSDDPVLRSCGILIRPHPTLRRRWKRVDPSRLSSNLAVTGSSKSNADPGLYDALHHATAAVGLSTSAFIEASILGTSVYTMLTSFRGQGGTLHFEYLLRANGGPVSPASDFAEHRAQLSAALTDPEDGRERCRRFVEAFVRPYGLDVPATAVTVHHVEQLAELRKRPRRLVPLWHYPARLALRAWLRSRLSPLTRSPRIEPAEDEAAEWERLDLPGASRPSAERSRRAGGPDERGAVGVGTSGAGVA